ncbi:hypothetical protein PI95_003880 [Hassallia byssoidea VB512170]|uniref:Single-stranded DNA-binding protein n=1 Tax=Hassallia byssoidea VB512170 TaxID=1304833 RepID=A0A846H2T3_9CYAN|nr:hypothetical protein [Hassalia byssoidea]NEU71746.1 hypothetical protein [Hassalia byssoidea VB512170]
MINSICTTTIKTINQTHDSSGSLIVFGVMEFHYRSKEGPTADEIPYRSKGAPAVIINELGEATLGTAIGFIDLQTDDRGTYKEKIATFVIRQFAPSSANPSERFNPKVQKPETPDFAKELVEVDDSVADENKDQADEIPF